MKPCKKFAMLHNLSFFNGLQAGWSSCKVYPRFTFRVLFFSDFCVKVRTVCEQILPCSRLGVARGPGYHGWHHTNRSYAGIGFEKNPPNDLHERGACLAQRFEPAPVEPTRIFASIAEERRCWARSRQGLRRLPR